MVWYRTVWGIITLIILLFIAVAVIIFSITTIKFWWQIKHGQGAVLQQAYNGFDRQQEEGRGSVGAVDRAVLENGEFPFLGNLAAPITIVLFGDFRCPNTKNAWPIMQKLLGQYGQKVKLVYRHFPGESIHPGANKLSEISMCAQVQGQEKYWGVHNYFFNRQSELPTYLADSDIVNLAQETGLDLTALNTCLGSSNARVKINRDYADGLRFGVAGTPTFFVNGQKVEGVVPWEVWEGFVKQF
jgi:protein-disulfide isomerase